MLLQWKKNILEIPDNVAEQVKKLGGANIVVACIVKIKLEDIINGKFKHLNINYINEKVVFSDRVMPHPDAGRYSKYNLHGREKVLRDLPMTTKSYDIISPNYGDWSKGSHEVTFDRNVYQREYFNPRYLEIIVKHDGIDEHNNHIFRFTIDEVLNENQPRFRYYLLFDINLIQENTGNYGVYSTDADLNEYLRSLYVNWEILPPGEMEENITRILSGVRSSNPVIRKNLTERFKFLVSLNPQNFVQGTSRFQRYFGAQFSDDLIVFENVEYGNAIYIMFSNWEELSKRSRFELLSSRIQDYIRIPHTKTWKLKLKRTILKEMRKRKPK